MINWETIKSLYNDKPTLMEWLKKVEAALTGATLTSVSVNTISVGVITLTFEFDDGTSITTPNINLPQGAQGVSITGAAIVAGKLILTLSNGTTIDAGNTGAVLGFEIDSNQHLIVKYQDGTSEDLGAIFTGNVNINGTLTTTGDVSAPNTNKAIDVIKGEQMPTSYFKEGSINLNANVPFATEGGSMPYGHWRVSNGKLNIVFTLRVPANTSITAKAGRTTLTDAFYIPASVAALLFDIPGAQNYKAVEAKTMIGTNYGNQYSGRFEAWVFIQANGYCRIDYANETLSNANLELFQRFEFNFIL